MRHLVFVSALLVLFSTAVQAETMYVSDLAEITLRTGQGIDHKIIAMVKSGLKVEVLEAADQWTRVRLPNGKEGWVVSRFLTSKLPSSTELKELKEKYEALLELGDAPYWEITRLKEENNSLTSKLEITQKTLNDLKTSYEALNSKSTKLLKHESNSEHLSTQLNEEKKRIIKLEEELSKLEMHQYVWWFLCGAAVLFVGFLMGFGTKRQRRRFSFHKEII
jgi:SH3 domain protein